jgi:hypothetical protein
MARLLGDGAHVSDKQSRIVIVVLNPGKGLAVNNKEPPIRCGLPRKSLYCCEREKRVCSTAEGDS